MNKRKERNMRKKVLTVTAIVSGIYVAALWVITSTRQERK